MADHRHERDTAARPTIRARRLAGPIAVLATSAVVGVGVLGNGAHPVSSAGATSAIDGSDVGRVTLSGRDLAGRDQATLSRGASRADLGSEGAVAKRIARLNKPSRVEKMLRPKVVARVVARADTVRFATADLNLWDAPNQAADNTGELAEGKKVVATGRSLYGREEVVEGDGTRWVTEGYLAAERPEPEPQEPALGGACTNGTSVPSGVSPNIVKVHDSVCASYPEITTYGTFRSDGEHSQGLAVDIMVSGDTGYAVADFVRANAAALGVNYVIYAQRIWSVDRASEGWRAMEDRGSTTANHFDHVHVTTY